MADPDREPSGLILGLGNPGERYRETRHNLGFKVLDLVASELGAGPRRVECNSVVVATDSDPRLFLAWPQTYMNRSGYAARCLVTRLEVDEPNVLVVYDDVSLPTGRLRMRRKGGPGGHRGMESIIRNLRGENVPRLRLGVGPDDPDVREREDLSDYVLAPFEADEAEVVEAMTARAAEACMCWWREGVEIAMNRYNVA